MIEAIANNTSKLIASRMEPRKLPTSRTSDLDAVPRVFCLDKCQSSNYLVLSIALINICTYRLSACKMFSYKDKKVVQS